MILRSKREFIKIYVVTSSHNGIRKWNGILSWIMANVTFEFY